MHPTLHPKIKGHVDKEKYNYGSGWAFHPEKGCLPIRSIITTNSDDIITKELEPIDRPDVDNFFGSRKIYDKSGWEYIGTDIKKVILEMKIDDQWEIFYFRDMGIMNDLFVFDQKPSTYLVVNNFYKNPDAIRDFALEQTFNMHKEYHKGYRTDKVFRPEGLKTRFEQLLGKKIKNWEKYGTNGCFQYCTKDDLIVYHCDSQEYAGIIYLTPDAPPESGTSLFRSKVNKLMRLDNAISDKPPKQLFDETFKRGFYDETQFDLIDRVGNVYNRLIIFDGRVIHAASSYFGDNKENGRLFQLFFFDLE